jgi:membrane protein
VVSLALLVLPRDVLDQGTRIAAEAAPHEVRDIITSRLSQLIDAASTGFAITGAVLALWGASRGANALGQALNDLTHRKETRPWWRRQLVAVGVTLAVALLLLAALALLVVGPIAGHFLVDRFDLGEVFDTAWSVVTWIGAGVLVLLLWAIAYRFLPDTDRPFKIFTLGGVIGVLLWLVASWAFGLYLSHAGSYEATYGTLGGAIIFLTWLWLSNLALLVGAEINDVSRAPS